MSHHLPDQHRDDELRLPGGRVVPARLLTVRAVTGGGPGGQHVNRTATRVEISVCVGDLPLSERQQALVRERLAGRINSRDVLAVTAGERRSQLQNRRAALRRMSALLEDALSEDAPRLPTRTPRSVRRRWREHKQHRSQVKRGRRWRPGDEH